MRFNLRIFIIVSVLLTAVPERGFPQNKEKESFGVAEKAFSDGFYGACISLFERFTEKFPESPSFYKAKLHIAQCHYHKENYSKALKILNEICKKEEALGLSDEVYYWMGVLYFKGKDFNSCEKYSQKVISVYPDSEFKWQAYLLLAQAVTELGNVGKAQDLLNKIIEESPDKEIADEAYSRLFDLCLKKKDYFRTLSLSKEYIKAFPKGRLKAKAYFYLGEAYTAQGEADKALSSYQQALKFNYDKNLRGLLYQSLGFNYLSREDKVNAKINIDKIKDKRLRLFSQGIYYFRVKDHIQALEIFNIFIRDYPQSVLLADAYLNKADILYELGRLNDAVYFYEHILDKFAPAEDPDVINKAHYGLAWCYLKNGKFKEAIDEFESAMEYADNPVVKVSSQIQIADAYQEVGKYGEALDIYSNILKDYPNTIYADYIQFQIGMSFLKNKDLEKALLALKNLRNNFSSSKLAPQAQYYLAVGYFSQEDYAQAKRLLEDFADRFPRNELIAKARYLYGKCFFNNKDYNRALLIFEKIIKKFKDPDIEELVYIDMANVYLNLSQFDKAKKTWEIFLAKFPRSQYAGFTALHLGGLHEKEGNFVEAEKYYKKVINGYKGPRVQEAELSLGHLYWSKGDLAKARKYFEKLVKKQGPFSFKAKFYLAKVFAQEGKNDEALKLCGQLINSSSPISKAAVLQKAFFLKDMKDYRRAARAFKEAVKAGVDTPEARFSLGLCLEKTGRGEEAIEEYLKAAYAQDYKAKAYFRIAKIYEKENSVENAKEIYRRIINSDMREAKIAQVRLRELEKK